MFNLFKNKNTGNSKPNNLNSDFGYLQDSDYYFDSACTTLRPQSVIDAEIDYYHNFNSCGHRVKYKWGEKTDKLVAECRANLLKLAGKSSKDYTVAFGLNTTHGINTVLHQIQAKTFGLNQIITSDIDHNSCFLPSITWAKRNNTKRLVLERDEFGSLTYTKDQISNSIVLTNTQSNIDGRELLNAKQLADDIHAQGGILLLDACQTFGHNPEILKNVDFDAAFGSGHKMYGPSVGFVIIKKDLLKKLDCYLIGGSTVQDVKLNSYELVENDDEIYARLEAGLQNYAGIIGLNEAIKWRKDFLKSKEDLVKEIPNWDNFINSIEDTSQNEDAKYLTSSGYERILSNYLNQKLLQIPEIKLLNPNHSPVVSLYSDKIDAHKMAMYLSEMGIMCRSGYHCCHYYLKEKMKYPPLLRISLGLHNMPEQIDHLVEKLKMIVK